MRVRRAVVALLCAGALAGCTPGGGGPGDAKGAAVPVWQPADQGLIAWDYDPSGAGATWNPTARTNGYLFLTAVLLRSPATLTHVLYGLSGAQPAGLTPGRNLIGLYSSTGRLLARTADQTPIWSSPEHQRVNEVPWTTPYHAAAGRYYVVFLCNGVT